MKLNLKAAAAIIAVLLFVSVLFVVGTANVRLSCKGFRSQARMHINWAILETYRQTHGHFPAPGLFGPASQLIQYLDADSEAFAVADAWGADLLYSCAPDGDRYFLVSYGGKGSIDAAIGPDCDLSVSKSDNMRDNIVLSEMGIVKSYRGFAFNEICCYDPADPDDVS